MKAWLKGGLIALGILILQVTISFICAAIMAPRCSECAIVCVIPLVPNMYFSSIFHILGWQLILIEILIYFVIGAIIGFIIGKIKSLA